MEAAGLRDWEAVVLPVVDGSGWDHASARVGLQVIRRLRAQLDAAQAQLVAALARTTGRDTRASLVRHLGMSARDAREAERVADVVGRVPGAAGALAGAEVSAGHLSLLADVADADEASELLVMAAAQPVDRFASTVRRHQIERHAAGLRERQRCARAVSFFAADDGNVGMRAILTPLDGERVKAMVNARCDANWRLDHPERAEVLGGHQAEPRERRMADAFVELMLGGGSEPADISKGGERRAAGRAAGPAQGSRIGVVVVIEESTLQAHIAGPGTPLGAEDVISATQAARADLYTAVRSSTGAIVHFGRSRRHASAIQKLALLARDGGTCRWPGCDEPWTRCDADHTRPWEHGGPTDLPNLRLLCRRHHTHRHDTGGSPDDPDPPPG